MKSPLSIYVLFHDKSDEGRRLAHALHDWFRLRDDDGNRTESGLPVWFRSVVVAAGDRWLVRPDIPWDEAEDNIVVVLGDRQMVADRAWRHALEAVHEATRGRRADQPLRLVLPVEVHAAIYQLSYLTGGRNPLRIGDPVPDGLPKDEWNRAVDARARLLRRAVTEAIGRELLEHRAADGSPRRLDVFLSHAKRDGLPIAERLRDAFAGYGQLRVWFDANDLAPGYAWEKSMREAARGLAALVSVVTDAYPTRPWCRTEVTLARTPQRVEPHTQGPGSVSVWRVQPTVAVHSAGGRWSRSMPQLVHVPHIGMRVEAVDIADRIADVVDRLVLEVLVASFQRRVAQAVAPTLQLDATTHVAMLTWVPEPWSLIQVLAGLVAPQPDPCSTADGGVAPPPLDPKIDRLVFAYPGHGMRTLERRELETIVGAFVRCCGRKLQVDLVSQERLASGGLPEPCNLDGMHVCLSGGGAEQELEQAGVGTPQVDDLFVRLGRRLLEAGCRLVYGGTLANLESNLTKSLIEVARGWQRDRRDELVAAVEPSASALDTAPLINFSPWPHTSHIRLEHEADLVGLCRFERVFPPGRDQRSLAAGPDPIRSVEGAMLVADALKAMRTITSAGSQFPVRMVVGGKIAGASGWLPGIAEEVLCALEGGQLPVILGGLGGCAGLLAGFLAQADAPWPEALTLEKRQADAPMQRLLERPDARAQAEARFALLRERLECYRTQLHSADSAQWPFPIAAREAVRQALTCGGLTRVIAIAMRVVSAVAQGRAGLCDGSADGAS